MTGDEEKYRVTIEAELYGWHWSVMDESTDIENAVAGAMRRIDSGNLPEIMARCVLEIVEDERFPEGSSGYPSAEPFLNAAQSFVEAIDNWREKFRTERKKKSLDAEGKDG